ncbi:MAG TPA: PQQ-binding-like beta-propeller repeat protein [Pseudonocardia sp.]|nr:PQQ-binding-like beta-propeller repeat protein [Pseudonocardia sp.]
MSGSMSRGRVDELLPGDPRRIGPYELLGRLGGGGMGRVFLAAADGGVVAVKVVHPALAQDDGFRGRFRQEIAHSRRIGEPWVAPVLDADPDAASPWLATAYIPGPSLDDAVARWGPLPSDTVHRLAVELSDALAHIHAAGVVHRDVKPSNVLLGPERPHLIDLGIARALDGTQLTATGAVIGTPAFMSPEQADGAQVDSPSDVFSFGSVVAFAAGGRSPFGDSSPYAVLLRVSDEEPDLSGLGGPLRSVVQACLAKDPQERPSAARVAEMLTPAPSVPATGWLPAPVAALDPTPRWLDRTLVESTGAAPATTVPPDAARPGEPEIMSRRVGRRTLLGGVGVLGIAGVVGTAIAVLPPGPEPIPPPAPTPDPSAPGGVGDAGAQPVVRWSTPDVVEGVAVLVTDGESLYSGGNGRVFALDARTGVQRWRFDAPPGGHGFARNFVSIAVAGGSVFAATYGAVHALDSQRGSLTWSAPLPTDPVGGAIDISASNGFLYAAAASTLLGLDPASGRTLWSYATSDLAASPSAAGELCLGRDREAVVAVADGHIVWQNADVFRGLIKIAVSDGVAVLAAADDSGTVTGLDVETGAVRWTARTGASLESLGRPPAVSGGVVTVLAGEQLHALDVGTGAVRWRAPDRRAGGGTVDRGPAAADGVVYAAGLHSGRVRAFDVATGAPLWQHWSRDLSPQMIATAPGAAAVFVASNTSIIAVAAP